MTRMSVGQKQDVIMKNVEEERAQYEAMFSKSLDEKEEEKKSESSSLEETSSHSETGTWRGSLLSIAQLAHCSSDPCSHVLSTSHNWFSSPDKNHCYSPGLISTPMLCLLF